MENSFCDVLCGVGSVVLFLNRGWQNGIKLKGLGKHGL